MNKEQLEKWSWILIYGGLVGASLGWFLRVSNDAAGWTLIGAGAVLAAVGAGLIVVRARMGP
jgi:F0F1-type ATP synthase assembly protein I